MVPHRPASPAEPTTLQNVSGIIELEGHSEQSFTPYPGKGLTVDGQHLNLLTENFLHGQLLGCDFGDLSLSNSMTAAIERGSQPGSTYPVNPNAGADDPINRQRPPSFPKHQTAAQLLPEHYAADLRLQNQIYSSCLPERPNR